MIKKLLVFLLSAMLAVSTMAAPAAIKNIDPKASTISRTEAYWIYSLKIRYWSDGTKITVFLLDFGNPTHISFIRNTLNTNPTVFQQTVESQLNTGTGSYRVAESEQEMFRKVSKIPGAVGYVSERVLLINSGDNYVREVTITD